MDLPEPPRCTLLYTSLRAFRRLPWCVPDHSDVFSFYAETAAEQCKHFDVFQKTAIFHLEGNETLNTNTPLSLVFACLRVPASWTFRRSSKCVDFAKWVLKALGNIDPALNGLKQRLVKKRNTAVVNATPGGYGSSTAGSITSGKQASRTCFDCTAAHSTPVMKRQPTSNTKNTLTTLRPAGARIAAIAAPIGFSNRDILHAPLLRSTSLYAALCSHNEHLQDSKRGERISLSEGTRKILTVSLRGPNSVHIGICVLQRRRGHAEDSTEGRGGVHPAASGQR